MDDTKIPDGVNKTIAGSGSNGVCRVIDAPHSPSAMNEAQYTASEANFSSHLRQLRLDRSERKEATRPTRQTRQILSASERSHIFAKTAGRCHICGGVISESSWHADHILAHSAGGTHSADNYLPAHALCNNYRWDYSAEEFQIILKLGVWTRTQIERLTTFGRAAAAAFLAHERTRQARRVSASTSTSPTQ